MVSHPAWRAFRTPSCCSLSSSCPFGFFCRGDGSFIHKFTQQILTRPYNIVSDQKQNSESQCDGICFSLFWFPYDDFEFKLLVYF